MVAELSTSSSVVNTNSITQRIKDMQVINLRDGGKSFGKVYLEDTYTPSQDVNKTNSKYYDSWANSNIMYQSIDSLATFSTSLKRVAVADYNEQNPDTKINFAEQSSSLTKYLDTINYKKEYEEYKQSRECTTDEELTALNKTLSYKKSSFINLTSCLIGSIDSNKYGPTASQIAQNANLDDLADFFSKFVTSNGNKNYQESILSELITKNTQNKKTPEEQAQAMREKYNSSLISRYAS